jgi:hypothetical protein
MQELTFVSLSEDGSRLLLALPDGRRFALPIDERLRAATRGSARPGQLSIPTEAGRPRDVQARLRAGATAEEVAESSGWPLSRVEAFAVPVLQERSYVAERACASMIRYQDGELPLEEVVAHRLAERAVDITDFRWDAWRGEDGRWTVLLAYPAGRGDQVATWLFDLESRTLQPMDEEAAWLTEHHEVSLDDPGSVAHDDEADEPTAQVVSLPAKDRSPEPEGSRHPALRRQQPAAPPAADQDAAASAEEPGSQERSRGKRATVPSWDEILFGGSGDPDERPAD